MSEENQELLPASDPTPSHRAKKEEKTAKTSQNNTNSWIEAVLAKSQYLVGPICCLSRFIPGELNWLVLKKRSLTFFVVYCRCSRPASHSLLPVLSFLLLSALF